MANKSKAEPAWNANLKQYEIDDGNIGHKAWLNEAIVQGHSQGPTLNPCTAEHAFALRQSVAVWSERS